MFLLYSKNFSILITFIILNIVFNSEASGTNIYGRLDFALSSIDTSKNASKADAVSHASRIGLKGKHTFDNGFSAIYKYETQIDPIDKNPSFSDRNSYLGFSGYFGRLLVGVHDTPVKQSQGNIDLFNDTAGDIKNILWGESRSKKVVQWNSPKFKGLTLSTMVILEKEDQEAFSVNLMWKGKFVGNKAYFAIGFDFEAPQKGYLFDTTRLAASIPLGKLLTLGLIWQDSEDSTGEINEDGYVVSLKMELSKKSELKVMFGESDMVAAGAEITGIGLDYKIAKPLKLYFNYIDKSYEDSSKESEHIMIGLQYNFNIEIF